MSNQAPIVIAHGSCHDGTTAAWVVKQKYPDAEIIWGKYSEPPEYERLRWRDVIIVDFSYKAGPMALIANVARSLLVLDHHKSAELELTTKFEQEKELLRMEGAACCPIEMVFDMKRSGAGIAWDHFNPGKPRFGLIIHVEDRDLWRFAHSETKAIHAVCACYPLDDLEIRNNLIIRCEHHSDEMVQEGEGILRYHRQLVSEATKEPGEITILGYRVPFVICPVVSLISDIGERLLEIGYKGVDGIQVSGPPFAAIGMPKADGSIYYSLRSNERGIDVSEVATKLGGGGHRDAAGFTLKPGQSLNPGRSDF